MAESTELQTLAEIGRFIGRYGLSTFFALVLLWLMYQDRTTGYSMTAMQLKDLNGQLLHFSQKLVEHDEADRRSSTEVTRVLMAQCVNAAATQEQRERCLGWR